MKVDRSSLLVLLLGYLLLAGVVEAQNFSEIKPAPQQVAWQDWSRSHSRIPTLQSACDPRRGGDFSERTTVVTGD